MTVIDGVDEQMPPESALLAAFLDSDTAILVVIDPAGEIVHANAAFERITGFAPEEALGRPIWEFAVPEAQAAFREAVLESFDSDAAVRTEWRWRLKAGGERAVSWATWPVRGADGEIAFRVATGFDMPEQRQVERRVAELAQIVENLGEAVVRTDNDYVIQYCNQAAEALYGYSLDELRGQNAAILRPPEEAERMAAFAELLQGSGAPQIIETVRLRKDGSCLPVQLRVSPLRADTGRIDGWVSITHDISERKEL